MFKSLDEDFGNVNTVLATEFTDDRLAITYFLRDYNYALYSYERFHMLDESVPEDKQTIHDMWEDDTDRLVAQYDSYDNLGYFLPYWRDLNSSHCTLVATWDGTEIQEDELNVRDYIQHLLDDSEPLASYREAPQPDEDLIVIPDEGAAPGDDPATP